MSRFNSSSFALQKQIQTATAVNTTLSAPIYGAYWTKGSSPTLTRTNNAVGMTANAGTDGNWVQNDFDNAEIYREIGPVTDSLGNTFIQIPKFYIRKQDGVGFKTWQISKYQYPGFYLPKCFWDYSKNQELPYIWVGAYKASLSAGNLLQSISGVSPLVNTNIVQMRTYAMANNTGSLKGYQQLDIHVVDVLQTLFYVEFATLNSQSVMAGWTNGRNSASDVATFATTNSNQIVVANATAAFYAVGQSIGIGTALDGGQVCKSRTITVIATYDASNMAITFDGAPVSIAVGNVLYNVWWVNGFSANIVSSSGSNVSNTDGLHPCIYRGIESPWGDVWQFVDGLNINVYQTWVCGDSTKYASNVFASPYEQLGYVDGNANGYAEAMGYDTTHPYAQLPVTVGGSAATYYSDYYYQAAGQQIALLGAGWTNGTNAGLSAWHLGNSSSYANVYFGGRLLKKAL